MLLAEQAMPWQKTAAALLQNNVDQESSRLATPLAELFATEQTALGMKLLTLIVFTALWLQGCTQPVRSVARSRSVASDQLLGHLVRSLPGRNTRAECPR